MLTIENDRYFDLWKKYQDLRNYPKIVNDINLFQITFFSALRSYLEATQKESLFTIDSRTHSFPTSLRNSIYKIRRWLDEGLQGKQTSSHFHISSNPLFSGVKISGKILVYPDGFEECYQDPEGTKWIHDSYITPVLSKVGELLGAKVVIEESSRVLARTLFVTSSYLGTTTETIQKVTFLWNRATTLQPLAAQTIKLQEGSWDTFLYSLQKEGRFCDISLKAEGVEVKIHAVVLYKKECGHLEDVDDLGITKETLHDFLDFLYMSEPDFVDMIRFHDRESCIKPLIEMAEEHKIASLMRCCVALLNLYASTWGVERFTADFSGIDNVDVKWMIRYLEIK